MRLTELASFTDDVPGMAAYYRTLLGADPITVAEGIAIFRTGDATFLIHKNYTPGDGELPPRDHAAYAVEDVDTTCRELIRRGLTVEVEPRDFDWGRAAYLTDPDGHMIELIQVDD